MAKRLVFEDTPLSEMLPKPEWYSQVFISNLPTGAIRIDQWKHHIVLSPDQFAKLVADVKIEEGE